MTTVEGLGTAKKGGKGVHPVQERIHKAHGTQCGFCTPGKGGNDVGVQEVVILLYFIIALFCYVPFSEAACPALDVNGKSDKFDD